MIPANLRIEDVARAIVVALKDAGWLEGDGEITLKGCLCVYDLVLKILRECEAIHATDVD